MRPTTIRYTEKISRGRQLDRTFKKSFRFAIACVDVHVQKIPINFLLRNKDPIPMKIDTNCDVT